MLLKPTLQLCCITPPPRVSPAKPRSRDLFFGLSAGHDHHTTLCLSSPNISHYTTYPCHQLAPRVSGYNDLIFSRFVPSLSSLGVLSLLRDPISVLILILPALLDFFLGSIFVSFGKRTGLITYNTGAHCIDSTD
ncbi:hypothetical protein BO99DRAFT_142723 [Aspergillus violaceofuscus CBS 115571]|uniref:Uncharacterized protein n=1 Tax=Aspergillus violaceofuscus (strain CBS 115571) TaxID=1450538 RepID=A0A2V5HC74_ASPV1|nr:hypothetical protein BO99DRAFT_142723 [Aspergillus violaceofuscus CBS 115571]